MHRIFPRGWPRYKKKKGASGQALLQYRKTELEWNCNAIDPAKRVGGKRGSLNSKFWSVRFETDAMIKRGEDKATSP